MKRGILLALLISTAFAALLTVESTPELFVAEDQDYLLQVTDRSTGAPVHYAEIKLYKGSDLIADARTNALGYASFVLHPLEPGVVAFSITAENYNEYVIFQDVVERPTPTPELTPTPSPPDEDSETTTPITGFLLMNPSQRGLFFFTTIMVFVFLFAASYLYYKQLFPIPGVPEMPEEETGAWESTDVFKSFASWLKRE